MPVNRQIKRADDPKSRLTQINSFTFSPANCLFLAQSGLTSADLKESVFDPLRTKTAPKIVLSRASRHTT